MKESYRETKSKVILFFKGLLMGGADIVPGVSGGTIALISGIYEHLIHAIGQVGFREMKAALLLPFSLFSKQKKEENLRILREIHWTFLIILALGILTGIVSMSRVIPFAMEEYPFFTYSLFFGLILASVSIPFRMMDHRAIEYITLIAFAAAVFFLVGYSRVSEATIHMASVPTDQAVNESSSKPVVPVQATTLRTDGNGKFKASIPQDKLQDGIVGNVQSAAGLPLGSFRLGLQNDMPVLTESSLDGVTLYIRENKVKRQVESGVEHINFEAALTEQGDGSYPYVFMSGALAISAMILPGISGAYILVILGEYRHILEAIHHRDLELLGVLLLGIAIGLFTFVRVLRYLLDRHHSITMAALTGIMIGSLRKIWPGNYTDTTTDTTSLVIAGLLVIVGAIGVFALELFSRNMGDPDSP